MPAAGMGIELASGANAMDVSEAVEAKLTQLAPFFPTGLRYHVAYSTTPFVKISIEEVVKTLIEAIVLVIVIMRSEEHTSELQSLMRISYAVFCLNKKKQIHASITIPKTKLPN